MQKTTYYIHTLDSIAKVNGHNLGMAINLGDWRKHFNFDNKTTYTYIHLDSITGVNGHNCE